MLKKRFIHFSFIQRILKRNERLAMAAEGGDDVTRQQRIISEVIQSSSDHPTGIEIYLRTRQILPNISKGTVYRNLARMSEEGTVKRITIPGGPDRYDGKLQPHEHLVCLRCGQLTDLQLDGLRELIESGAPDSYQGYELRISYLCPVCRKIGKEK